MRACPAPSPEPAPGQSAGRRAHLGSGCCGTGFGAGGPSPALEAAAPQPPRVLGSTQILGRARDLRDREPLGSDPPAGGTGDSEAFLRPHLPWAPRCPLASSRARSAEGPRRPRPARPRAEAWREGTPGQKPWGDLGHGEPLPDWRTPAAYPPQIPQSPVACQIPGNHPITPFPMSCAALASTTGLRSPRASPQPFPFLQS